MPILAVPNLYLFGDVCNTIMYLEMVVKYRHSNHVTLHTTQSVGTFDSLFLFYYVLFLGYTCTHIFELLNLLTAFIVFFSSDSKELLVNGSSEEWKSS